MFDDYSIKIDYIQGIEEWKCKGETFFFGEFEINDQLQIVDGSWEFFFNTLEPHRKVYKGDYVEGRIFLLSYFDKNFESLLEREKKIQRNLNFRAIGHDEFQISSYKDGNVDGIDIVNDCSLYVESYHDGLAEGAHEEWVCEGDLGPLPYRIENYRQGKLDGLCRYFWDWFDQDGHLWSAEAIEKILQEECLPLHSTINYKDGKKDGIETIYCGWYPTERLETTSYKKGKKEGVYEQFFYGTDLVRGVKGKFKDGKKDGLWSYYDEEGNFIGTLEYEDGKLKAFENSPALIEVCDRSDYEQLIELDSNLI